jgi:hypothetical protein
VPDPTLLALTIARAESLDTAVHAAASGLAEITGVALVRLWRKTPIASLGDHACAHPHAPGSLHLLASAGQSITGHDWSRIEGKFYCLPLQPESRLAQAAISARSFVVDTAQEPLGVADRAWVAAEQLTTFVIEPLRSNGESQGVLACFLRAPLAEGELASVQLVAAQIALLIERDLNRPALIPENEWREQERRNLIAALEKAKGRISGRDGAADLIGVPASTFASRLKALDIDPRPFRKKPKLVRGQSA